MNFYDVQITTDLGEIAVLQVCAYSETEAELTAISMVENGEVNVMGTSITGCFVLG